MPVYFYITIKFQHLFRRQWCFRALCWQSFPLICRSLTHTVGFGDLFLFRPVWHIAVRNQHNVLPPIKVGRGQLKCDATRAETRFRLSAKRTSSFKSVGGRQFSRLLAVQVCASAVVMLDTTCSEVVWRVLATHCIRQFPLNFPSRASPCAITFQMESKNGFLCVCLFIYFTSLCQT